MKAENIIQLKPDEEVLEVVHEDVVPHAPKLALMFLWLVAPFFFLFPLLRHGLTGVLIFLALLASGLAFTLRVFYKWKHTALIITDRRIVDVDQRGFFERSVTETPYTHIDEVAYRIKGFVPTIFRLGVLEMKTSGQSADIEFSRVRQPARIQNLVNDLRKVIKDERRDRQEVRVREMAERFSEEEIDAMMQEARSREREEALNDLYAEDDA